MYEYLSDYYNHGRCPRCGGPVRRLLDDVQHRYICVACEDRWHSGIYYEEDLEI